jgi:hypothetical protein
MVKVTPHDNLVPDVRDLFVRGNPHSDLIHNLLLAKDLIRGASQFFHLRKDAVIFSGYLQNHPDMLFSFNLWHEGVKVRELALRLGFGGALHCETVGGEFHDVVGWDLIGSLARDKQPCLSATAY